MRGVLRAVIEPRKPRHRVLRAVLAILGVGVLAVLLTVAVVLGAAMIAGGLLWRLVCRPQRPLRPMANGRVLDATYRVVRRPALSR
ncbi:MAG: hypothetical protein EPO46_02530 [Lysobacter sp.]|nr:MAG: hypothetical protein EPO46_02530 [Lysobacter sp.]